MNGTLAVTGDDAADQLVNTDPLALLLAMLLDQQVPMEWAFVAPARLRERMGGELDPRRIAAMDPDDVKALFAQKPALHRFPGSMATRAHRLCQHLVEHYGGDAAAIWTGAAQGDVVFRRLRDLPGFGDEKARIFVAVLAKRMGQRPVGWEEAAGPFADEQPRSVADIGSREAFADVKRWKKAQKARNLTKAD